MAARLLICAGSLAGALGYPGYMSNIPNGDSVMRNGQAWRGVGHTAAAGGPSAKNPFGTAFAAEGRSWTQSLCEADSDGDGQSNGVELGDPYCTWTAGGTPSRTTDISHPGYADSTTSWTAPSAGETTTTSTASTSTASTSTASTATATATQGSGTPTVGTASNVGLTSGLTLDFQPAGSDAVRITVRINKNSWVGFGVSAGSAVSMSGSGLGADVVACSNGEVRRYWVTSMNIEGPGVRIPGAVCAQEIGLTTMTFTRKLAAEAAQQRSIVPGKPQQVIFAHGADGATTMGYHGASKGGQDIDFSTGDAAEVGKRSGEASLYLHLVLMSVAWAGFLPLGAVAARWLRRAPGAPKDAWLRLHKRCQMAGWSLQLLGFVAAVWYAQQYSSHFHNAHGYIGLGVVAVGTLQPLNAALRPHPKPRTNARIVFEVVHKGCGWLAVLLGMLNVAMGISAAVEKGYDAVVAASARAVAVLALLPASLALALARLRPDNPITRFVTGAKEVPEYSCASSSSSSSSS
mmetsp:Transcript_84414/g.239303  ORF Transcript_84414/g.239303 Transcript_84414/m.239303 type:complete len:519 (+) Transcript_84414:100-1656(+)